MGAALFSLARRLQMVRAVRMTAATHDLGAQEVNETLITLYSSPITGSNA